MILNVQVGHVSWPWRLNQACWRFESHLSPNSNLPHPREKSRLYVRPLSSLWFCPLTINSVQSKRGAWSSVWLKIRPSVRIDHLDGCRAFGMCFSLGLLTCRRSTTSPNIGLDTPRGPDSAIRSHIRYPWGQPLISSLASQVYTGPGTLFWTSLSSIIQMFSRM